LSEGRRIKKRYWVTGNVAALAVVFTVLLIRERHLILEQTVNAWTEDSFADCAVVLTGGPNRIREGLDLLARKSVKKLILSGVHPQSTLRQIFPQLPYYGDFNEQDVILERRAQTTFGNAQQTLPLVEALNCRDLIIVTSRVHMRRALLTFRAEFPPDFPLIARAVPGHSEPPSTDEVLWESLKALFYSAWAY
jgi:uncharacterized SAM-binding protein YcdF (DUF218 family)